MTFYKTHVYLDVNVVFATIGTTYVYLDVNVVLVTFCSDLRWQKRKTREPLSLLPRQRSQLVRALSPRQSQRSNRQSPRLISSSVCSPLRLDCPARCARTPNGWVCQLLSKYMLTDYLPATDTYGSLMSLSLPDPEKLCFLPQLPQLGVPRGPVGSPARTVGVQT